MCISQMARTLSPSVQIPEQYNATLFEALDGNNVLLEPNPPHFTILAASPSYIKLTGLPKAEMIGKGIFEAFPGNSDPVDTGANDLRASLQYVLKNKKEHQLPVQRYDTAGADGQFTERYWKASNKPVLSAEGEVSYIIHTAEEITDQVKAKRREIQVEGIEKAYHLFMQVPAIIGVVKGVNHVLELANDGALKLWGKGDEIIGKPLLEALPELAEQGIIELFDQVLRSGKPVLRTGVPVTTYRSGTEEQLYFDIVYQPYFEKNSDRASGVFTISHDVTELVNAKRKVEENEEKYRSLFDSMDQGYCTLEVLFDGEKCVNYRYLETNPTFERHLGMSNALGKTILDIAPDIEPKWFDFYGGVALTGKPIRIEEESKAFNKWFEVYAIRVGDPEERKVGVFFTDITERKKAEEARVENEEALATALEQIRLSKEAAELGTFDMDLEKGTMHWDERCRTLFGISHCRPVTYEKDFLQGLHPDDRERVIKVIDLAFTKTISDGDYDVEYRTIGVQDGVVRWLRAKGKVYFSSDDKPLRFIGSVLDITEKVAAIQKTEALVQERTQELAQSNELLRQLNKELRRSNSNLEEFAHAASHDLKEPVRKIQFYTHLLKSELMNLPEKQARTFNKIESSTQRMGHLIDDLLLYSHVAQRSHDREIVDLNQKLHRVLDDLELEIAEKHAQVKIEELPMVKGHPRQLQQLFQNLVSNALKYCRADISPVIHITAHQVTENDRRYHVIAVKDNGIGFEAEYHDKIFQIFTRLHNKTEYGGTGVGLSIVKKVVENLDGMIKVESVPEEGSTFYVYLPVE